MIDFYLKQGDHHQLRAARRMEVKALKHERRVFRNPELSGVDSRRS